MLSNEWEELKWNSTFLIENTWVVTPCGKVGGIWIQ
jgi:hypothetical protein